MYFWIGEKMPKTIEEKTFQLAVPKIDFVCGKITEIVRPRGEFLLP
jgi:hypothetical protein